MSWGSWGRGRPKATGRSCTSGTRSLKASGTGTKTQKCCWACCRAANGTCLGLPAGGGTGGGDAVGMAGSGPPRDTHPLLGHRRARPRGPRAGSQRLRGRLPPFSSGHRWQGGAGVPQVTPGSSAPPCLATWDPPSLAPRKDCSEGRFPSPGAEQALGGAVSPSAIPQPRGTTHRPPAPSQPRIPAGSEHPLPPRCGASPIPVSPAPRAGLGRAKGCGKAGTSSLPSLKGCL